jgi:hypothetical protein
MTSLFNTIGAFEMAFDATDVPDTELTFAQADPAQRLLLDVIATALASELGSAWDKVVASFASTHPLFGKSIVQTKHTLVPTPAVVRALGSGYPALFIHRSGQAEYSQHTLHFDKRVQQWQVHWILGGLANEEQAKLYSALQRVSDVVLAVVRRRGHPDYQSGASILTTDADGFAGLRVVNAQVGPAAFADGEETFLASLTTLESVELVDESTGHLSDLSYSTISVDLGETEDPLADFAILDSRYGPTDGSGTPADDSGFSSGFSSGF